ncbi:MAG: hypothetical protein AAF217_03010 [Pseudomonadota bacterium]
MRFAPMLRSIDVLLLLGLIVVVAWTFKVKYDSQNALDRVAELERQIAAEKVEIDLLKSDWSLLTNPARLQELAERYADELNLQDLEASQLANEQELPNFRLEKIQPPSETREAENQADKSIETGSIPASVSQEEQ